MKKKDYKRIIDKRRKVWDTMGYGYRGEPNRLFKNHSLNCGCSLCRYNTYSRRKDRRDDRHNIKLELKDHDYGD